MAKTVADACSRSTPQVRKEAADRRKRVQQLPEAVRRGPEGAGGVESERPRTRTPISRSAPGTASSRTTGRPACRTWPRGATPCSKSLAQRELNSPPAGPEDQVKLADAWWDAAADRRGEEKAAMLRCAGHWYEQAIGSLEGINKTKVEKRLAEIAELGQEPASRARPRAAAGRRPVRRQAGPRLPAPMGPLPQSARRVHQLDRDEVRAHPAGRVRYGIHRAGGRATGSTRQDNVVCARRVDRSISAAKLPGIDVRITRAFYLGRISRSPTRSTSR